MGLLEVLCSLAKGGAKGAQASAAQCGALAGLATLMQVQGMSGPSRSVVLDLGSPFLSFEVPWSHIGPFLIPCWSPGSRPPLVPWPGLPRNWRHMVNSPSDR